MTLRTARDLVSGLLHDPRRVAWHLFRLRHRDYRDRPVPMVEDQGQDWGQIHERNLRSIVTMRSGQSFLEVGIGWTPRTDRLKLFQESNIRYSACDFAAVCERHRKTFKEAGLDTSNIRFLPNQVGTYAWPLMELVRTGEQFDVAYLDGHHTFYVDLPAVFLIDLLLKPGGCLLLDDIVWTLNFMKRQLYHRSGEWSFYRDMYDFDEYATDQQAIPHIRLIAESILIARLGYQQLEQFTTPFWWALRKPDVRLAPQPR